MSLHTTNTRLYFFFTYHHPVLPDYGPMSYTNLAQNMRAFINDGNISDDVVLAAYLKRMLDHSDEEEDTDEECIEREHGCPAPVSNLPSADEMEKRDPKHTPEYVYGAIQTALADTLVTNLQKSQDAIERAEYEPWQKSIIDLCGGWRNDGDIHWLVDEEGLAGKTRLIAYLRFKYIAMVSSGTSDDMMDSLANHANDREDPLELMVVDVPPHEVESVNYYVMSTIKNGLDFSDQDEQGHFIPTPGKPRGVFCFADGMPEMQMINKDCWSFWKVINNRLVKIDVPDDEDDSAKMEDITE